MNVPLVLALIVVLQGLCVLGLFQVVRHFREWTVALYLVLSVLNEALATLARAKPKAFAPDIERPTPAAFTSDESNVA